MPKFHVGKSKTAKSAILKLRKPLRYRSGAAERDVERVRIRRRKSSGGKPSPQTAPTEISDVTGPGGDQREIVFATYTPLGKPKIPGLFNLTPPDMSGADSQIGVVLYTGNSYLSASNDSGLSFEDLDSTTFLPKIPGRAVDQVITYVPGLNGYAWMMQHDQSPSTKDGNFRLAIARVEKLKNDFKKSWRVIDFTSSDCGFPACATDRQDLTYTDGFLYLTTNIVGKGRLIIRITLDELNDVLNNAGAKVTPQYLKPLDGIFDFSDLSKQNGSNAYMAGIVKDTILRVVAFHDGTSATDFHELSVGKFPVEDDLVSRDPDGVDWLTKGVANVSAVLSNGDDLWIAWDAAASKPGDKPFYPNAHVRIAQAKISSWKVVSERQIWNPNYAFAYGTLAVDSAGDIGYGVAVGGKSDFPNACFGILGDFVVYYRDTSDTTAIGDGEARWGDYITVRPSLIGNGKFAGFGYFTKKTSGSSFFQTPYYLQYGRP
jgi:hypothetical protein